MSERWRPIPGYEPYEASDLGRIRRWHPCESESSARRGIAPHYAILRPRPRADGSSQVSLCLGRKPALFRQPSVLVLLAFVGPQPSPRHRAHHINGDVADDRLSNLRWEDVEAIAAKHTKRGEDASRARFTNAQVRRLREEVARKGWGAQRAIARRLGIAYQHLNNIIAGRNYSVAGGGVRVNGSVSRDQALAIIRRYRRGTNGHDKGNAADLARKFRTSHSNVFRIVSGQRKDVRSEALAARRGA